MLKRVSSTIACAFLLACGGDGGPSGPGNGALTLRVETDTARVGTLLRVNIGGGQLLPDSMPATLGDVAVALGRTSDSTASMLVPEMTAGSRVLRLELGDRSAQTTVTVLAGQTFADPSATVNALLDAYAAAIPTVAPDGVSATDWTARRATFDSLVADTRAQIAAATPAERVAVARLLSAFGTPPVGAAAFAIFKVTDECKAAARAAGRWGFGAAIGAAAVYGIAVQPSVAVPFKAIAITAALTVFTASALNLPEAFMAMVETCKSQETVDVADDDIFPTAPGAADGLLLAQRPEDKRFHNGITRTVYPFGLFRPISGADVADDPEVLSAADWLDEVHATVADLPGWVRALLPALPPRVSQRAPQPAAQEPVDAATVRIESVSPSSVTVSAVGSGRALNLTATSSATQDVQFTYDVVSIANPTIRTTRSATFRPSMTATTAPEQSAKNGTRTQSVDPTTGAIYGTLSCSFTALVTVKGGDTGGSVEVTESMSWNGGSMNRVVPWSADGAIFSEGVYPISPNAYFTRYSNNGQPEYRGFSVSLGVSFVDNLTGVRKSAGSASFSCQ